MRIIAGTYRGRLIEAPPENITRPTIDRVREAIFSSLMSIRGDLEGAYVLDAFSGSGAMALEAISRGAKFACLLERNRTAHNVAKQNIQLLGIKNDRAELHMVDAFAFIPIAPDNAKFDIVFLDPPYSQKPKEVLKLLENLVCAGSIFNDAICLYEHDKDLSFEADAAYEHSKYALIKRKNYGRVVVDILQ